MSNGLLRPADPMGMMLAQTAADYAPNWPVLGLIFVGGFLGFWALIARSGNRDRRGTRANLEQRLRIAEHDAMVEQHARRARDAFSDD